jgi:predicted NBD/HSP70 family sugar kinase
LFHRVFDAAAAAAGASRVLIALEQADGSVCRWETWALPPAHPFADANFLNLERQVKFLLWSRGGYRVHVHAPAGLADRLALHYTETATGRFDADIMGARVYERPFEVVAAKSEADVPAERQSAVPLGRHLEGCRIGFDLGASDRKAAAVIDGRVVFSEEIDWNPVPVQDPQWHFDQIMDSLRRAAAHLPRVDAIGGSSAGVYVNNRVKLSSLLRGVPAEVFDSRVKDLFLELGRAWKVPFEIANDGEVTALAGSMSLNDNAVLGIAMGSSLAGGYVTPEGRITSWLDELAFVPVDYQPNAPADEWSGDVGCGVQYFSQQAVGRLAPKAGVEFPAAMPLPERLKGVQHLMEAGDPRAAAIYRTVGAYLGYGAAHFARFYSLKHILILGRVTTGGGGDLILQQARAVLDADFPELASRIQFHTPDEQSKRHGQAIAAASLPAIQQS